MTTTLATTLPEQQTLTCSTCPFSQQIEGNRYSCALDGKVTRGHWEATQDCKWALEDEQAKAQEELEQHIDEQADAIAPEIKLIPYEIEGLSQVAIEWQGQVIGDASQGFDGVWYLAHTDRPFTSPEEAAVALVEWHQRRQNFAVTQGTLVTAINRFQHTRIIGEDITGWSWHFQGYWTVTVTDTAQPYTVTLEQLEEATRQPEYTAQEVEEIEADILRF